jgi:ABC-type multidrug transport system fused ATPase/permease subunit
MAATEKFVNIIYAMITLIQKIWTILTSREKRRMGWLMVLDVITSMTDILFLAGLLYIVHIYTGDSNSVKLPLLPASMMDKSSLWPIGIFFLLFCIKNGLSFIIFSAQANFRYGVASRISHRNLLRYLGGSYSGYRDTDSSVHVLKIAQQPIEFCQFELAGLQQGLTEATLIVITVIAVLLFNAKLFLLLLALLLPPVVVTAWLTKRRLHKARVYIKTSRDTMWQHLQESIASFVETNLYDKKEFFSERYGVAQQTLNRHLASLQAMQGAPSRLAEIFAVFGLLALIGIGHFRGNVHATEFVTLGAFLAAAYKIIPGIARLLNIAGQMKTYDFTINGLMDNGADGEAMKETMDSAASLMIREKYMTGPIRSITCRRIHFSYDKWQILEGLDLHLEEGSFVGVRGDSGKGKTTLLNILLGFVKPERGEILVNGEVRQTQELKEYWKRIAYVKQQPFIIHDSLLANITLDEQHVDEQRLQNAIHFTGLDELVEKLPGGLRATIAENGRNISGGQRQRIALARALYKDPDLFLLDEPFSELDEASEQRLLANFQQLTTTGKMVLMITHNNDSFAWCTSTLALTEPDVCLERQPRLATPRSY